MKFICVIASLLLVQACVALPAVFEVEDLTVDECVEAVQCISEKLNDTEFDINADELLIVSIVNQLIEVAQGYLACQAILGDPPTRWEEIQHSTCMALWRASALITAVGIQRDVSNASDSVRESWGVVQDTCTAGRPLLPCINHLIETPDTTEVVPY